MFLSFAENYGKDKKTGSKMLQLAVSGQNKNKITPLEIVNHLHNKDGSID
jgi:hypothetical protein